MSKKRTWGESAIQDHKQLAMADNYRKASRAKTKKHARLHPCQMATSGTYRARPADIKRELQEIWAVLDSKKNFVNALRESGYFLARGGKRGYVSIDIYGEVYS